MILGMPTYLWDLVNPRPPRLLAQHSAFTFLHRRFHAHLVSNNNYSMKMLVVV
jgi:hypothetical protein